MEVVLDNLDQYALGLRTTVVLTLASFMVAVVVGTIVAACRVSPIPPLRWAGATWVELVRNTPLAVLFVLFFFGFTKIGLRYGATTSAVIVLGAYTSTFVAETLRSGINTVSAGQAEAGRSLGLTFGQLMRSVVLPQAFRAVVAPMGTVLIALTKNSSLASLISVLDITEQADRLNTATAQAIPVFLGAAVAYMLLTVPTGWLVGAAERRLQVRR